MLISPRHFVMANHSKKKPVGRRMIFNDRKGKRIPAIILAIHPIAGGINPDICVGILDRDIDLEFFRVLPPRSDYRILLRGAPVLVTDQQRDLFVHRISHFHGRRIAFSHRARTEPEKLRKKLIGGDSGAPSFVVIHGKLVLVETHTFGGGGEGPFFSHPENFRAINAAMKKLGGDFQLEVVEFQPSGD